MRFHLGALLCLMTINTVAGANALATEHTVAMQSIANGVLITKCEISTVESDGYALQVRVTQDFDELNIGGYVALLNDDQGLLRLIDRAAGSHFEEFKNTSRKYQILYSIFSEGPDGTLIETPIQGYGKRNIESSFPHKLPLIELIDRLCNTDPQGPLKR